MYLWFLICGVAGAGVLAAWLICWKLLKKRGDICKAKWWELYKSLEYMSPKARGYEECYRRCGMKWDTATAVLTGLTVVVIMITLISCVVLPLSAYSDCEAQRGFYEMVTEFRKEGLSQEEISVSAEDIGDYNRWLFDTRERQERDSWLSPYTFFADIDGLDYITVSVD